MSKHKNVPYLTSDVARASEISPRRVQQLEAEGAIRAIRTARGLRLFDPVEIEAYRLQRQAKRVAALDARRVG